MCVRQRRWARTDASEGESQRSTATNASQKGNGPRAEKGDARPGKGVSVNVQFGETALATNEASGRGLLKSNLSFAWRLWLAMVRGGRAFRARAGDLLVRILSARRFKKVVGVMDAG